MQCIHLQSHDTYFSSTQSSPTLSRPKIDSYHPLKSPKQKVPRNFKQVFVFWGGNHVELIRISCISCHIWHVASQHLWRGRRLFVPHHIFAKCWAVLRLNFMVFFFFFLKKVLVIPTCYFNEHSALAMHSQSTNYILLAFLFGSRRGRGRLEEGEVEGREEVRAYPILKASLAEPHVM